MDSDDIWARPPEGGDPVLLEAHLEEVEEYVSIVSNFDVEDSPSQAAVARTVAGLHDFGKVAPQFQQYLRNEYQGAKKHTYHSRIGSLATFHASRLLGAPPRDQLAACLAVARHHGRTPNAVEYVFEDVYLAEIEGGNRSWVGTQIDAIEETNRTEATELFERIPGDSTWATFRDAFSDGSLLEKLASFVSEQIGFGAGNERDRSVDQLPPRIYDAYLKYWGALTIADKTSAAGLDEADLRTEHLPEEPLLDHIDGLTAAGRLEANLNAHRERARQEVSTNVTQLIGTDADIGRITLPTGLGKTFTGISTAFSLRDELAEHRDLDTRPTVIYALPYTSIIEQTRDLFESEGIWNADPRSSRFGVHHYLSETVTDPDTESIENGEPETDHSQPPAALLGESWRSGTMLTTFVQLFESLAGPTNSEGLKLPALENAVVILDEPQAVPLEWWPVVPRLVDIVCDQFDGKVIAMTATQPAIFQRAGTNVIDLVSDVDQYFEASSRVTYDVDASVWDFPTRGTETPLVSHEAAAYRITDRVVGGIDGQDSGLAICNTIASSRQLTASIVEVASSQNHTISCVGAVYEHALERVHAEFGPDPTRSETVVSRTLENLGFERESKTDAWRPTEATDDIIIAAFNSRYRPIDRRALIRIADELATNGVPFVMVATQAVEAGVDLSFSAVWRDIAPLDSIVQAAGRCNRSFEWGEDAGDVTVWWLSAPDDPAGDSRDQLTPAEQIYHREREGWLETVAETLRSSLSGQTAVPETELTRNAVPTYFEDLSVKDPLGLIEKVETFEGEALGRESLIVEEYETVDVLVGVTDSERARIREIGDLFHTGEIPAAYRLLSECADYRISIPVRDAEAHLNGVYRVDREPRGTAEGPSVLAFTGQKGAEYDLATGGFVVEDDGVSDRFTT